MLCETVARELERGDLWHCCLTVVLAIKRALSREDLGSIELIALHDMADAIERVAASDNVATIRPSETTNTVLEYRTRIMREFFSKAAGRDAVSDITYATTLVKALRNVAANDHSHWTHAGVLENLATDVEKFAHDLWSKTMREKFG